MREILGTGILTGFLSGCGAQAAGPPAPPSTPTPPPTPTVTLGFEVVSSAVPATPPRPTPRPTATPFVIPAGPYLELVPNSGPPISRTILVRGGGLPHSALVDLEWTISGHSAGVGTAVTTSIHGKLGTRFRIPGAPPGRYKVMVLVGGVPYATAWYTVRSAATLTAEVAGDPGRQAIVIRGRGFVPRLRLLLIAYPLERGSVPRVLAETRADTRGRIDLIRTGRNLRPGEYLIRAWSESAISSQMAQTILQVEL
ncbi:MAG: hypothetical protein M3Z66_11815 [Chloroflexota bacterium]|nr:hypothetical protein [Chloroflexota bacterium]